MTDRCPQDQKLLRECSACHSRINRISDPHVLVAPSWKRCNDVLCKSCFTLILRSAETVIRAQQRGAVVWLEEPLPLSTAE